MKTLKKFCFIFFAILVISCENEPLHSTEESADEIEYLEFNANGETKLTIKNALSIQQENENINVTFDDEPKLRLYNSQQEFIDDCRDLTTLPALEATGGIGYTSFNHTYFGVYLEVIGGEDLIEIVIRDTSADTIYQETRLINELTFFGIAREEPMGYFTFGKVNPNDSQTIKSTIAYIGNCDFHIDEDSDGDGIPDEEDLVPNSNMEETVVIEECDSSVENRALGEGYMVSDKIDELEAGEYKNHGQYVKATAHYLNSLVEEGIINYVEKDMIMNCAGSSSIGK